MALSTNAESQRELFVAYIKARSPQTTVLQPLPVSLFSSFWIYMKLIIKPELTQTS